MLPLEIIDHILSFVDYLELYRYRQVSHIWRRLTEQRIFDNARHDPLILAHDGDQKLSLVAHNFDAIHKVIEFRPRKGTLFVAKNDTFPPSIFARMVKLFFEPWKRVSMPGGLPAKYYYKNGKKESMTLPDNYNPAFEQRYMLPVSSNIHTTEYEPHLIAKRGIIVSFSYVHRPNIQQQRRELERQIIAENDNNGLLPINQRGYPASITATTPWLPRQCGIQVHWVKASLAWVISGFHPYVSVPPLYPEIYDHLQAVLGDKYRIFRYDVYSEPITKYILQQQDNGNGGDGDDDSILPKDLVNFLRTYIEDDDLSIESRLSQVERMLEQENIDPRVLWKYRFVRYGIVTNFAPGNSRDAIITRILAAEKRVQQEKQSIIKQYNDATALT
ncbi:hypothetical protein BDA99DRAFT_531761 [Phascolomyces articulosus]|uniref:F-box domain-containing protein n=1 Tax=Phascolomyces articulosus TaxID=60185 RepID=A0AAD5KA98_9FUNG|nr:hypothetical protein BDA99DRAFT_531761 [Phascolomyces articulosus]